MKLNKQQLLIEQIRIKQEIIKRLMRNHIDLLDMTEKVFPDANAGTQYRRNWHHEIIARELEAWDASDDPDYPFLIITVPPRHGKTEIVGRNYPAWKFGKDPNIRIIGGSYAQKLQESVSRDIQRIMTTDSYHKLFPYTNLSEIGKREQGKERTSKQFDIIGGRGTYLGRGVGVGVTGFGADRILIDDPHKGRKEAESMTQRDAVWDWYRGVIRNRLAKGGRIAVIMTRWHEDDLVGRLLEQEKNEPDGDKWKVVCLPAVYEKHVENEAYLHPDDHREEGQALWPDEFDEKALGKLRAASEYDWHALFQQMPTPAGGAQIKRDWINVINEDQIKGKKLFWVRYWDLAVSKKTTADFTASVQLAIDEELNTYLRRIVHKRETWPVIKKIMLNIGEKEGVPIGIEAQGTQKGFVDALLAEPKLMNTSIKGYTVEADKLTRALPFISRMQQGKFFIIDGSGVDVMIEEMVKFTGHDDLHDDIIDAISGAFKMLFEYCEAESIYIGDYVY